MMSLQAVLGRIVGRLRAPFSRSTLDQTPASEWERETDYRQRGLTVAALKDALMAEQTRQLVIRDARAAARPIPIQPGRILCLADEKARNLRQTEAVFARSRPLLEAQREGASAVVRVGDRLVRAIEVGAWNNNRYSKSWHNRYGGVYEVSERRVELCRVGRLGALEVVRSVSIEGFRGHWLMRAVVELLDLQVVRVERGLRAVQMDPHVSVEEVRSLGEVVLYRRSLAGETVDFCVTCRGETYHASSQRAALRGLRRKLEIAAQPRPAKGRAEMLTAASGRAMGFCEAGMRAFCARNGLDFHGSYSRAELRAIVARDPANATYWRPELTCAGLL